MATTKASAPSSVSASRGLSFEEFVQVSVSAAARAIENAKLPGGPHPIWIGIIIRPPDFNPQIIGQGGQAK
jgi:hypothetical protein